MSAFPQELLETICTRIYQAAIPVAETSLDPLIVGDFGIPTGLPSSFPAASWPESVTRKTLSALCLVNHAWNVAAKPLLWHRLEVRLPHSWLALLDVIATDEWDDLTAEGAALIMGPFIREVAHAALAVKHTASPADAEKLERSVLARLSSMPEAMPDISIPPDLLSPPASRDPSPRRLRDQSKSPTRWRLMRTISDALLEVIHTESPEVYVPHFHDPHPGRHVAHLDFNHFRTVGMRRSVDEGIHRRFVTDTRLHSVLKEMPNLHIFGATEYMDGALTLPVLEELFLRGAPVDPISSRGRSRAILDRDTIDEEDRERWRQCKALEAIDLTGCVSSVLVAGLTEFVQQHLGGVTNDETTETPSRIRQPVVLHGVKRLGLRGTKSIPANVLDRFVLSMPSLTHLDLSCTRVTPDLLGSLSTSPTLRLHTLSLERCTRLSGESIRTFLVSAPAARDIRELNLYGDGSFPSPLSPDDLRAIITQAPCVTSGQLVYLDVSSAPFNSELLAGAFPAQPALRSLGLSHIPHLTLTSIRAFLEKKASRVEVLTLVGTSPELGYGQERITVRQASLSLHTCLITPLCRPPFSLSTIAPPVPTCLRVLELSVPLLNNLGAQALSWRVIRSKGGRGWYVDTASGWVADGDGPGLRRDLPREHAWRVELDKLADANGNVSSGIGWHSRKMEVLHGHGMLGREDGLYGAVAFAYQG